MGDELGAEGGADGGSPDIAVDAASGEQPLPLEQTYGGLTWSQVGVFFCPRSCHCLTGEQQHAYLLFCLSLRMEGSASRVNVFQADGDVDGGLRACFCQKNLTRTLVGDDAAARVGRVL